MKRSILILTLMLTLVAGLAPAGATTLPAPRYFTASMRNDIHGHNVTTCHDYGFWDIDPTTGLQVWYPDVICSTNVVYTDVLLVRVYNYTHTAGVTYACYNPTESASNNGTVFSDTWSGLGCVPPAGSGLVRRALSVTFLDNTSYSAYVTGTEHTMYVRTSGFLPLIHTVYRYKCTKALDVYTSASSWYGDTYVATSRCPVG
jgi:hypothetical protein